MLTIFEASSKVSRARGLLPPIVAACGIGMLLGAWLAGGIPAAAAGGGDEPGIGKPGGDEPGGIGASAVAGSAITGAASTSGSGAAQEAAPRDGLYSLVDPDWASAPLWDDGNAEINLYAARLEREFALRDDAYAVDIVVKEPFTPEYLVKADDFTAPGTFDVLKLNHLTHATTGMYDWNEMTSVFLERGRQVPIKAVYSRQEWCGNVFKEWRRWREQRWLSVSSYFDGAGTARVELPLGDEVVPHDALPLLLRALRFEDLEAGESVEFRLLPSLSGVRVGPTEPTPATLRVGEVEEVTVPAGTFRSVALRLEYAGARGVPAGESWWIEADEPHRPVQLHTDAGEALQLARSERLQYWRMSGDEVPWFPAELVDTED